MSIICINHYAGSPKHGMEFRPFYISKEWVKSGEDVLMIAATFSHLRARNPKSAGFEDVDGVPYLWLRTNKYNGNGLMRLISMFVFLFQLILITPYLAIKYRPKSVIASSTYLLDIFPCKILALMSGAKVVFEIHDLWPLSLEEQGGLSKWHPFVLLMRFSEWCSYKLSDGVVSIPTKVYKHAKKFGLPEDKFLNIPNGISLDNTIKDTKMPQSLGRVIKDIKAKGGKIVGYAGALGVTNNIDRIMDIFKELKDRNMYLVIVADGQEKGVLQKYASGYDNIIMHPRILKTEILDFLGSCDALIIFHKDCELYKYGISLNKTHDYMLSGRPVIYISTMGETIIGKSRGGVDIDSSHEIRDIAGQVADFLKVSDEELKTMGQLGKAYVKKHNDYKILAKRFLDFINKL